MSATAISDDVDTGRLTNHSEYNDATLYPPPERVSTGAHVSSMAQYSSMHARSINDPSGFWGDIARESISWFRPFTQV